MKIQYNRKCISLIVLYLLNTLLYFSIVSNVDSIYDHIRLFLLYNFTLIGGVYFIYEKLIASSFSFKIRFSNIYFISIFIVLYLLKFDWMPNLFDIYSENWGFDPQRYYFYATEYLKDRNTDIFKSLNYKGIVYIWSFCFYVFGVSPIVPALINLNILLWTIIFMTNFYCRIFGEVSKYIPYFLLFPELLWYSVMSSREILCMCLMTLSVLSFYYYRYEKKKSLILLILSLIFLTYIRLPFLFICVFIFFVYTLFTSSLFHILKYTILISLMIFLCLFIYSKSGSANTIDGIVLSITSSMVGDVNILDNEYSENSIALLLIPSNVCEYLLFGFLKSFIYILPTIPSLCNISALTVSLSGLILTALFPCIISGLFVSKRFFILRYFFIVLAILFLSVGYSTVTMIHVRYRIVYDFLFMFLTLICFKYISQNRIKKYYLLWGVIYLFGFLIYISVKKY